MRVQGEANVIITGSVIDSNIVITVLGKNADYQQLVTRKTELEDHLADVDINNIVKRSELQTKIGAVDLEINAFKENVIALAEKFSKIIIDTERLKRAKALFENGNIQEANNSFNDIELENDARKLALSLQRKELEIEEIRQKQKHIAEEYLLKGDLSRIDYSLAQRWEAAEKCYQKSLSILHFKENIWAYGGFLAREERWDEAYLCFEELLDNYDFSSDERKLLLYSLGTCFHHRGKIDEALQYFNASHAIQIDISNSLISTIKYEADSYHNKALVLLQNQRYVEAIQSLEQALYIREQAIKQYPGTTMIAWKLWTLNLKIDVYLQMGKPKLAFFTFENTMVIANDYFAGPIFYDPQHFPTEVIEYLAGNLIEFAKTHMLRKESDRYFLDLFKMSFKLDDFVKESNDYDAMETMVRTFVKLYDNYDGMKLSEQFQGFLLQYDKLQSLRQAYRITLSNTQTYVFVCLRLAYLLTLIDMHEEAKEKIAEGKTVMASYPSDAYLVSLKYAFDNFYN